MSDYKLDIGRGCRFKRNADDEISAERCDGANKLNSFDWLQDVEALLPQGDIFEVRFKNTRKGYYRNVNNLPLKKGDIVAVESSPGHDIGIVSLGGEMVALQMKKNGFNPEGVEFKKIYRIAKPADIAKWQEAIALEYSTMIRARVIAASLGLNMKIGDVEYQGDKVKAIFYYIADERVDFRELIKIFAEQFRVRIEMKQIGARQEAGRIGGIGSCGRELCCSSWVSNFVSVTTNSARFQEISLNPQKLAGQCGKLKCCLNYEVDSYIDARRDFPQINAPLETTEASYYLVKSDIFKREMSFSSDPSSSVNVITIPVSRVREIIRQNRKGIKVDRLQPDSLQEVIVEPDYKNVVGEESITRFDNSKPRRKRGDRNRGNRSGGGRPNDRAENPAKKTSSQPSAANPKERPSRENRERRGSRPAQNAGGSGEQQNRVSNNAPRKRNNGRRNNNPVKKTAGE